MRGQFSNYQYWGLDIIDQLVINMPGVTKNVTPS
jgi:hypothetical protein